MFYNKRNRGRGFLVKTKCHLGGWHKDPNTGHFCCFRLGSHVQMPQTMRHPRLSRQACVAQLGPPFVRTFLYVPHPLRRKNSPVGLLSPHESHQFQTEYCHDFWKWLIQFGCSTKICENGTAFRHHVDSQTSAADGKDTRKAWQSMKKQLPVVSNFQLSVTILTFRRMALYSDMKTVYVFKLHRCLWDYFSVICYCRFPQDIVHK